MKKLTIVWIALGLSISMQAQALPHLMYIGTLDKKLLVFDEDREEVVGEIPLGGIPRTAALSADKKKLYIFTTRMNFEVVDLEAKKVVGSFDLSDARSRVRMGGGGPDRINIGGSARYSGIAVDPQGHYLYTTMRVVIKDIDQYRIEPPQFVAIDLQDMKIAKSWPFPKDQDQGFGLMRHSRSRLMGSCFTFFKKISWSSI
jgi:hypothetical protein